MEVNKMPENNIGIIPSFKANLTVLTKVKDNARLQNIQRIFSERTPELTDTLALTKYGDDNNHKEYYFIGTKAEQSVNGFLKDTLDNMMKKLSDNEIASKLVKVMKALKELNLMETTAFNFASTRFKLKQEIQCNLKIADDCHEKGEDIISKRHIFIAKCLSKKLDRLDTEQRRSNNLFLRNLLIIADGDREIMNFKRFL